MAYKNKADQAKFARLHYLANIEKYKSRAKTYTKAHKIRLREIIREAKKSNPCARCGLKDHRVMEFHHLGEKDANVANMVQNAVSVERLLDEMAKCSILCANCHRIIHYQDPAEGVIFPDVG